MIATYNEDGSVNVMNAAWGTMVERVMADGKVDISRVDAIAFDPYIPRILPGHGARGRGPSRTA